LPQQPAESPTRDMGLPLMKMPGAPFTITPSLPKVTAPTPRIGTIFRHAHEWTVGESRNGKK
jgi:hypothetical protein